MSKTFKPLILTTLLVILSFFISQEAQATACADIPLSGNYTVTSSCVFAGTVNGVELGNLTVASGTTLTINSGQTVVWNPGSSIFIEEGGSIAINKGLPGGQIRKTYLWLTDADNDGYPSTSTQIAQNTQPANAQRRKDFTNFTYVTDIALDTNESNDCVDTVTHACCDDTNPTDGPDPKAAGCGSSCTLCDGSSLDAVNISSGYTSTVRSCRRSCPCPHRLGPACRQLSG